MKKLLNKPLKAFTIYAFIVLACSVPVYYFIIDTIWVHEINEHNSIVSETAKLHLKALSLSDEELKKSVDLWNKIQPETKLQQVKALKQDSLYNVYRKNSYLKSQASDRFQGLVTYFELNDQPYSLTVEANVEETYETIFAITGLTILFFIILLTGFIFLNKKISEKLWNPFYQSLQKIRLFELSAQQLPIFEKTDIAEFEEMNNSIKKLIDGNITTYQQQKEFIENASHELQTPIAVVQSKIDLLLQSRSLTNEQSDIINETNQALSRISRINKNLLLLAKIENLQFSDSELVNLSDQVTEIVALLADFIEIKRFKLVLDVKPNIKIEGNKMLIDILLTNLLMNAIRHSFENDEIIVVLSEHTLTISNTGITKLISDKLFKRFNSASIQSSGSGLGLAIVGEIAKRYGWKVSYLFQDNKHHFILNF